MGTSGNAAWLADEELEVGLKDNSLAPILPNPLYFLSRGKEAASCFCHSCVLLWSTSLTHREDLSRVLSL